MKYLVVPLFLFVATAGLLAFLRDVFALFLFVAILALSSAVWLLRNFYDYYLDAWIITNTGIIDVEWHGWFHRESSRVLYSDIQGVSYELHGVWQTLLRFGQISVEKISTGSSISMDNVPRPRKVEKIILQHMESYMHSKNLNDASAVQEILSEVLARELRLKEIRGGKDRKE